MSTLAVLKFLIEASLPKGQAIPTLPPPPLLELPPLVEPPEVGLGAGAAALVVVGLGGGGGAALVVTGEEEAAGAGAVERGLQRFEEVARFFFAATA